MGAWTTKSILDAASTAFNMRFWDVAGDGSGPFEPGHVFDGGALAQYETVAASQTAQVLGASGAAGDYLAGVLVIPATLSPGNILVLDNATSITVFTGGASSILSIIPFFIPLGIISVSGAWKITTGANVSAIGIGKFT